MPSLYDTVRASVDEAGGEERVEVNQRALIDKILARYASAGAVYRELLQNSNDADATIAEIYFTTEDNVVTTVEYRNNGMPFRPQDWSRLKKIAEGNPDESKIGAFGVGAYTMFSICEEPIVLSGTQALAFVWKGDALWTKTINNNNREKKDQQWTSFVLPSRDPYPFPDLQEFGEFLCASLTFTRSLKMICVYCDGNQRLTITKTLLQPPSVVEIQKSSSWWKKDGANTMSPNGLFALKDENSLLESFYHVQVSLDGDTAAVTARYLSATAKTNVPANMVKRMERVTKKKPPSKVEVQIFLNGQQQEKEPKSRSKASKIVQSFSPPFGGGRIFIGFRTSQTTGLGAHLAAPFVPTVEREAMDLQDPTLRTFNTDLLEFAGILMRLTLEHGMSALGSEYEKGAAARAKLEQELLRKEQDKQQSKSAAVATSTDKTLDKQDSTASGDDDASTSSSVWGFAKFMAKGVKKQIVNVLSTMEELVDDGGELLNPSDPRPLCAEEHQAILLMQSFCPKQSTPDPLVGTAIAKGFARCLPDKAPPVLTRSGVVAGDKARLPNKGMEAFCKEGIIRTVVYKNAEEYHNVIARCRTLNLEDLEAKLGEDVLEQSQLIRFLKWWVRFNRVNPGITNSRSLGIKESIRFSFEVKKDTDALPVFALKDFLFYSEEDKIPPTLPIPDSVLPKTIVDSVGTRNITSIALSSWFAPLPIEVWVQYIGAHPCMAAGKPEDETMRVQVLSILSQEFSRRSPYEQGIFGSFCQGILKERRCIPFDSSEPTGHCADCPSNLYLYSAKLEAFAGIGHFHKASLRLKHSGITEDFLVALGVRKSVAIDILFTNLDTLRWSDDPKPLVEYLRSATLTRQDVEKLKTTQYLPSENDQSRMFAPSELYLPDRELRVFPVFRLLQWPSDDELTERTLNGKFLVALGMKVLPPLVALLRYISNDVNDETMRVECLHFVCKRLGSGGAYQKEFSQMARSEKASLKFMPCVVKSLIDNDEKKGLYSCLHCCFDERCGVMGFPIIDPDLGDTCKLFGNLFQCVQEPGATVVLRQLMLLVDTAKARLNDSTGPAHKAVSDRIIHVFSEIFGYLSSRSSEMNSTMLSTVRNENFIPCIVNEDIEWFKPQEVFFKSSTDNSDSLTESLFRVIEFSPFLAAAGVKQEASTKDVFRLMIESPKTVLNAVKSEAKYRSLLRRVAAHRPFSRVTKEIREAPFLIAYTMKQGEKDTSNFQLAAAKDIYIIDNSFFGRMFPVQSSPHESDLEDFYALIGSKYISKEVNKSFDVVGNTTKDTKLTLALGERIHERSPLLVSPSITSRPLVSGAASILDETKLIICEAEELKAVYSLGSSVRSQRTTCCSQPLRGDKNVLYITRNFDWFDVGYALGELILSRCQLEDAFFISSLLEAPLEQLRSRGFPVDRIIKPEPLPEPSPLPPPPPPAAVAPPPSKVPPAAVAPPPSTSDVDPNSEKESNPPRPMRPQSSASVDTPPQKAANGEAGDQSGAGTVAQLPPEKPAEKSDDTVSTAPTEKEDESQFSKEGYISILKQMYPDADESFIRNHLGEKPTLDNVRSLAEEMSGGTYPKEGEAEKKRFLGSKRLGRAFSGLRSSNFGGVNRLTKTSSVQKNEGMPVEPEADATAHSNMERMLEDSVGQSRRVDPNGVQSPDTEISIPEGLDRGSACEAIPAQNLKPYQGPHQNGRTHNGIQVFSARLHPSSEEFVDRHFDAVESFAVVLERLCGVYSINLSSVAIFHDPSGGTIAFNSNRSLHFNVRFFYALHYMQNKHNSRECYSYWFVTAAHELAHHMTSGHNKEHGFYTESYVSLYLPKLLPILAQQDNST